MVNKGLLPRSIVCPGEGCSNIISKYKKINAETEGNFQLKFVCPKRGCQKTISAKTNTWFSNSKISIKKSLILTYCFVTKCEIKRACIETSGRSYGRVNTSLETVCDLYSYCREVCVDSLYSGDSIVKIGGINCTVEIDESKFGRRKYNKGRIVEGQWVLGGICRESRECFLVPVSDRSSDTLIPIILERVEKGTIIITDEWRPYNKLNELGYTHKTVNHSEHFVDPITGAHTNLIENTWWCVKRQLPSTHTTKRNFLEHLAEYMWRRRHSNKVCLFSQMLEEIKRLYPGI